MKTKFLDNNGLLYVWKKLKDTFAKKVELDEVKNSIPKNVSDLQDADSYAKSVDIPTKVESLSDATDYAKKIEIPHSVSELDGMDAYAKITALPKKVADLTDGADYIKKAELTEEVKSLIGNTKALEFSVVEELPSSGEKSTIYLVSNSKAENDAYDEYIFVNGKFEKIGTTSVDLSDYVKTSDITSITNEEIDTLFV
ncbi:hypothetical protein [Streptococcus agalactiae]|uniref:hypothetical protein n=1 Tax=Streptococcus agalactiae TaxID=1311 RepID=UPI00123D3045|nr:hypothetical protein [Streptococcus agalactiae]KAA8973611.1 hypothetical protein F3151_04630 [Streptococcus agalactiae]KAA8975037.1 hypothetical protein F3149_04630 [Streptococcus agalactiae]KAA9093212.1 hypothetical protein F5S07_00280 [Streptococcus agalactiae]KAA9096498.1 hypothetical protein F5V91_00115 [Streptococcus agalactiae]KAA9101442.1 hypothetical protein F5042_04740 [Streptococcus agalactiae]